MDQLCTFQENQLSESIKDQPCQMKRSESSEGFSRKLLLKQLCQSSWTFNDPSWVLLGISLMLKVKSRVKPVDRSEP